MLPVTHGRRVHAAACLPLHLVLFAATLLPFAQGMSGWLYLVCAVALGAWLHALRLAAVAQLQRRAGAPHLPLLHPVHLSLLFAALLLDHYLMTMAAMTPDAPFPSLPADPGRLRPCCWPACDRASCRRPQLPGGVDITGARLRQSAELTDPDGKARSLADFKGKLVVVFFGYTQCPDVCPTTLAELAEVRQALGADGDKLQGVFVTVDPERDSAAVLKDYVATSAPASWVCAARPSSWLATAKSFKVFFRRCRARRHQLHHGPHGRLLRLRHARPRAPVRALRHRGRSSSAPKTFKALKRPGHEKRLPRV